jgi:hypothetical protein
MAALSGLLMGLPMGTVEAFSDQCKAARTSASNLPKTDANLLTALDVSASIFRHQEWLQYVGLARAVRDPDFLAAATSGIQHRIGFAVYTWSSGGRFTAIVPWTIVGSQADAEAISQMIENAPRAWLYSSYSGTGQNRQGAGPRIPDGETDISSAMSYGLSMMVSAPYQTNRSIINIVANGPDNAGAGPGGMRDLLSELGVTANALVLGGDPDLAEYYRNYVVSGSGSFVLEVSQPEDFKDSMIRKFLMDLVS